MKSISFDKTRILLTAMVTFFVLGYIIYPLWQLLKMGGFNQVNYQALLSKPVLLACQNSFLLSIISVAGSALIGTFFAYTFHYKKIRFKKILSTLILLPIAIPPMVGVMAFLFLAGENGMIVNWLGWKNFHFTGWPAIIIIHIYSFYSLFYLLVGNTLRATDNSLVEAAYSLGASKWKIFWQVILPQLKFPLLSAALLTFMASMASFSAPFIFNGNQRFLTTEIYNAKINGDVPLSALLAILLTFISLIVLFCFKTIRKKLQIKGRSKGTQKIQPIHIYQQKTVLNTGILFVSVCVILLPILSLILISMLPDNALTEPGISHEITFIHYQELFSNDTLLEPLINSLEASFWAITITVILGLIIAELTRKKQNRLTSLLDLFVSIPYGIPGTVIGICLILSFNQPNFFSFHTILVGTFWILPIAYTIRNLPILAQAIQSALFSLDPGVEEAAYSLGAGRWKTWRTIILPLIAMALIEGTMLVFINSFGEFVATVLLYNYSTQTMPIEIYAQLRMYNTGLAATYGVLLFAIILLIIFLARNVGAKFFDYSRK